MRLVDTSAWIEWLSRSPFGEVVSEHIPEPHAWLVPTIVQMELLKWAARAVDLETAEELLGFSTECEVVDLDTGIAVEAASLSSQHKLSTADAIIYATALAYGAELLTCDRHFEGLPSVRYIPKLSH